MPLIILGLLVVVGIVIYALVRYGQSEEVDTRPVRERYPFAFPQKRKGDANYTVIEDDDEEGSESATDGDSHTLHFPDDAEVEKRKRNIH